MTVQGAPGRRGAPPRVVWLGEPAAREVDATGGKGAALAVAQAAGLPVLPGFVLTTAGTREGPRTWGQDDVRRAWAKLSQGGRRPLVVRSSSAVEDQADTSMAGRFTSVVGVQGWDDFLDAVQTVVQSRRQAVDGVPDLDADDPIAVLVQPLLAVEAGGVLFGLDPVTGREDRLVVSAVAGAPERLVSGEVSGTRYELDPDGVVQDVEERPEGARLSASRLAALAGLAAAARRTFQGPQDVEWAFDTDGSLWLLQSRPVTTPAAGVPTGPVLGPGPVAETFPETLSQLEQDLWVVPLRRALREAFRLAGAAPPGTLDASPLVVSVGGRVAVDLEVFGEDGGSGSRWALLDPRPKLRRLRVAARVGRLHGALPGLAEDLVQRADALLLDVPDLDALTTRQLVALLDRSGEALVALHAHEVLLGLLVKPDAPRLTGTSVALRVLAHARSRGLGEEEILVRHPVVLALVPPRVQAAPTLPDEVEAPPGPSPSGGDHLAILREALRLRVRWVQELSGRAAWLLGTRLVREGLLERTEEVRHLRLEGVQMAALGRAVPSRVPPPPAREPLPARFRLTTTGDVVAVRQRDGDDTGGTGAGGGRGRGPVHLGEGDPPEGAVLVVRTLDPRLARLLPRLAGLVAETGSVLAHAAILARESGVPTVVGVPGAVDRYPPGGVLEVDGDSGDVHLVDEGSGGSG